MASSTGREMRPLRDGYRSEIDSVDESTWFRVIEQFDDVNIYQTWAYDEVRCGRENISHFLLKKDGTAVAAAQSRLVRLPFVKAGIAYVRWGPIWRRHGAEPQDPETFRQAIRALRNEYACGRGLLIRLRPVLFRDPSSGFASILNEEGFLASKESPDRTLCLDVSRPLEELRSGLKPQWRRHLKVAENNGLEIIEGSNHGLFDDFIRLYKEMVDRKRFVEPSDIRQFQAVQERLPERFKMKIMLCKSGDKLCAGLVCSAIGNTGVYLFGATSNAGRQVKGAYLLHWRLIEWLKQNGVSTYDLHGIDPVTNPGTYRFKADLCGNNGRDVYFLGRFESYTSPLSHSCVACGDSLRGIYQNLRKKLAERGGQTPSGESGVVSWPGLGRARARRAGSAPP